MKGRHLCNFAVVALVQGCGGIGPVNGATSEYEAALREAQCDDVESNTYYAVRPVVVRPMAQLEKITVGLFGITVGTERNYEPNIAVGIDQGASLQITEPREWPAESGFASEIVIKTEDDPLAQPLLRARITNGSADIDSATVHVCQLLATKRVDLAKGAAIDFEVTEFAEGRERTVEVAVGPSASRSSPSAFSCGTPHAPGVRLLPGDTASIEHADGAMSFGTFDDEAYGPAGVPDRWKSYNYDDLESLNHGSLVLEWDDVVQPVEVGHAIEAKELGCLRFFVNDTHRGNDRGEFRVRVRISAG